MVYALNLRLLKTSAVSPFGPETGLKWLPLPCGLSQAVSQCPHHGWMMAVAQMAALNFDVLGGFTVLFQTALPSGDAIGFGIKRCTGNRWWCRHVLNQHWTHVRQLITTGFFKDFGGVVGPLVVTKRAAHADDLAHLIRKQAAQFAGINTAQ